MTSRPPEGTVPPDRTQLSTSGAVERASHITRSPIQLPAGTVLIGTYEITEHINTGGMGEVYRGINIHNDEVVAIKIVLPALAHDEKILSLFQKESTVLRRIAHDAIVRYEVFTIDPGISRPCLVMEFVKGVSLGDHMDHGALPEEDVLRLLRRLADGLAVAHRAGVVHRDLSPDNVILPDDRVENAKIIDFGIAKETKAGGGTLIGGQFAGKPGYVAPEQLGLYEGHVTGQADIYSLGLLAAAAARGQPLDMGDNPADAVRARMSVPDLSDVPDGLRALLAWMLQPDPADRPADMAALLQALSPASQPPQTQPGPSVPPVSAPPGSQPPGSAPPGSQPPVSQPPPAAEDTGGSPFGAPPATSPPPATEPAAPPRRGGAGRLVAALLVVAGLGLGGAWYGGFLPLPARGDRAAEIAWMSDRAARGGPPCRRVQPAPSPDDSGGLALEGFAARADAFTGLRGAFAEAHGRPPAIDLARVSEPQCAALDFLSRLDLPFAPRPPLVLRLTPPTEAGDSPAGQLDGAAGQQVALLLIDPAGRLQNLSATLDAGTGAFTLPRRRLRGAPDGDGAPFLVMALSGAQALGTAALIPDNAILPAAQTGQFWQFLESDIASTEGGVRATLAALPAPP
ncbi:serine/threonine-protein kinase [Roseovarius ramblicola]|uniref:Serine/threonine-protein kinase n=1 Tax=Roseovarius ramblicola TaxID=2022336 RepID=A0ABV5I3P4_9RHOB